MTTSRRADERSSAAKNEPFAHVMQIISRTPRQTARSAGAACAGKIALELTAYRARVGVETGTDEADRGLREQDYRP
jgi:hypothetical protein